MKKRIVPSLLSLTLWSTAVFAINLDFSDQKEVSVWRVSNDIVMGGRSNSTVKIEGSVLIFTGYLSLENNGGFASVWRTPEFPLAKDNAPIRLRVNGDGRTYQLRFRTRNAPGISYFATFTTSLADTSEHVFEQQDFAAVWRGRSVTNAPKFQIEDAIQVGFLLADKIPGQFELKVHQIAQLNGI